MDERIVHASRVVRAPAATIFELIADPAHQPAWDGDENLAEAAPGQRVRAVGDVFVMRITTGAERANTVSAFVEGRTIAWRPSEVGQPPIGHEWRWDLEDLGDGTTRVTHAYDWTHLHDEQRERRARATTADRLLASVDRLAALAEGLAAGSGHAQAHEDADPGDAGGPDIAQHMVVVVAAHDPESLDVLVPELLGTADGAELDLEVVVVPTSVAAAIAADEHAADDPRVDVAPLAAVPDDAASLARALREAASRCDVVVTLDGHGRNDPAELPALLARLEEGDVDLVVGVGLAQAAAPGFVVMRAPVAAALARRVGAGVERLPVVAASLGLAIGTVDVEDRDASARVDVVDGWHAWHDRVVLAALDRRVLRIAAACGAGALVASILLGLAFVVPAIIGLGVASGAMLALAMAVLGGLVLVASIALDAVRIATRERG